MKSTFTFIIIALASFQILFAQIAPASTAKVSISNFGMQVIEMTSQELDVPGPESQQDVSILTNDASIQHDAASEATEFMVNSIVDHLNPILLQTGLNLAITHCGCHAQHLEFNFLQYTKHNQITTRLNCAFISFPNFTILITILGMRMLTLTKLTESPR